RASDMRRQDAIGALCKQLRDMRKRLEHENVGIEIDDAVVAAPIEQKFDAGRFQRGVEFQLLVAKRHVEKMRDAERAEWDCAQLRRRLHDPVVPSVGDEKMEIDGRLGGGERLRERAGVVQIVQGADRKICNAIGQAILSYL